MIFDAHMHVGTFPLFGVSLDRDGLASIMQKNDISECVVFTPNNAYCKEVVDTIPGARALVWANPRERGNIERSIELLDDPTFIGVKLHPLLDAFHPITAELSVMLRGGGGARDAREGIDPSAIEEHYERLEVTCRALLAADGLAAVDIELARSADVRYRRQTHELIIEYDDVSGNGRGSIEALVRRFERAYEEAYGKGSGFLEAGIEITTLRVRARGRTPKPQLADAAVTSGGAQPSERMVYDSVRRDFVLTAIHQCADLGVGDALCGPAVVEHASTTVFIGDTQEARVDRHGNLIVQSRIDG